MLKYLQKNIIGETEKEYTLDVWNPMLNSWEMVTKEDPENDKYESFISKMMEIERACVEDGDSRPIVNISKDFITSHVIIHKKSGETWTYTLHPYGYKNQWEIFKVERRNNRKEN